MQSNLHAKHVFFPAAALFAATAPWLLVLSLSNKFSLTIDPSEHAKTMLFGFIGALIAGYLLGKLERGRLFTLFVLWLGGRLLEVFGDNIALLNLAYCAFGALLAYLIAPKFLVAKKWRNMAMAPLIAAIGLFPLLAWFIDSADIPSKHYLHSFILLISLLMYFIGGRFITPLATRAFADLGTAIPHRVQPVLEAWTMLLISLAVILSFSIHLKAYSGFISGIAALLILLRLYRWKLHNLNWRFLPVWALAIGYAWLGVGLLLFSVSLITYHSIAASLHVITIGAVGMLSTCVILNSMEKRHPPAPAIYLMPLCLITAAVICRFSMPLAPQHWQALLKFSVFCWSLNYFLIFIYCVKCLINSRQR